jgi:hypothetical protein
MKLCCFGESPTQLFTLQERDIPMKINTESFSGMKYLTAERFTTVISERSGTAIHQI